MEAIIPDQSVAVENWAQKRKACDKTTARQLIFQDVELSKDPSWPVLGEDLSLSPISWSVRRLLYLVNGRYVLDSTSASVASSPVIVHDPGFVTNDTEQAMDDYDRVEYYKSYLNEMLKGKVLQ